MGASTLPFIFLFLPQLLKNAANLSAGNAAALAVLSWLVSGLAVSGAAQRRLTARPRITRGAERVTCLAEMRDAYSA